MESPKILQEEIKELSEKLEQKKKELDHTGAKFEQKNVAKEIVREYTASSNPSPIPQNDQDTKRAASKFADEPHAQQIEELLNIASKKGILEAVEVAKHLKNPHILDDFHDRMVLELLKRKK